MKGGARKTGKTRKPVKYGIKAYGSWFYFGTKEEYEEYLKKWVMGTEGAERDRAVDALSRLWRGVGFTDTDKGER